MAINVKLPEALVESARRYGKIEHRSVPESRLIVAVIARAIHECRVVLNPGVQRPGAGLHRR